MDKSILGLLIPLTAIVMGCAIPMVWMLTDYRKRKELFALLHQERMAALEKGLELPPVPVGLLNEGGNDDKARSPHHDFGWGLFWLLGGGALLVAMYFNENGAKYLYALIPIAIGLHYLIYYFVVGKKAAMVCEATGQDKSL